MNLKILFLCILFSVSSELLSQPVDSLAKCSIAPNHSLTLKLISSELDFYEIVDEGDNKMNKNSFYYPFLGLSLIVDYSYKFQADVKTETVLKHYFVFKSFGKKHIQMSIYQADGTKLLVKRVRCDRIIKK